MYAVDLRKTRIARLNICSSCENELPLPKKTEAL